MDDKLERARLERLLVSDQRRLLQFDLADLPDNDCRSGRAGLRMLQNTDNLHPTIWGLRTRPRTGTRIC